MARFLTEFEKVHVYPMAQDPGLLTLNSNLLVVVDIITTGIKPKYHDLIQICVLPLNSELNPHKGILPFYTNLQPKRPDNIDSEDFNRYYLNLEKLLKIMSGGIDAYRAADLFEEWYQKINLKYGKKLSVLSHDWTHKKEFLIDWLGPVNFESYFDYRYRDLIPAALFANDRAEFMMEQIPYPKTNLAHLCSQTKTEHENRMTDLLLNCVAMAECYRRMLKEAF